jgi:hypothetical protein
MTRTSALTLFEPATSLLTAAEDFGGTVCPEDTGTRLDRPYSRAFLEAMGLTHGQVQERLDEIGRPFGTSISGLEGEKL